MTPSEAAEKKYPTREVTDPEDWVYNIKQVLKQDAFLSGYNEGVNEIEKLEFKIMILEGECRSLRADKLNIQKEAGLDPYWYWPQCDVEGCEQVSCCGGTCWRDTGYWSVCPDHSAMHRRGDPQPQMKQSSIDKEKTRDENGLLPPQTENKSGTMQDVVGYIAGTQTASGVNQPKEETK